MPRLYVNDLAYVGEDSDGILRLNRGTTPSDEVPFPSFLGDVRLFRGLASQVGEGDLKGWALVGEVEAGTLIRVATTDAEVGTTSGSNTITVPIPTIQIPDKTPAGTVNIDHDHGTIQSEPASTGGDNDEEGDAIAGNDLTYSLIAHEHDTIIDPYDVDPRALTGVPITFDPINLTPVEVELEPQAISFYLIEYIGVTV